MNIYLVIEWRAYIIIILLYILTMHISAYSKLIVIAIPLLIGVANLEQNYYLSHLAFPNIEQAEILAQKEIAINPEEPLTYDWKDHGFKVTVPAGALSGGVEQGTGQVNMYLQASLQGEYQFPDDLSPVSGVYSISVNSPSKVSAKKSVYVSSTAPPWVKRKMMMKIQRSPSTLPEIHRLTSLSVCQEDPFLSLERLPLLSATFLPL